MELPSKIVKKQDTNPKTMIVFSQPKMGKTTLMAQLKDNLIIDLEKGTRYVDAYKVEVNNYKELLEVLKECIAQKKEGKLKFKYVTIDTVTKLESLIMPKAIQLYQATPMGKNYTGNDVTTLPNGAGYGFIRKSMDYIAQKLQEIFEYVIFVGHVKSKSINKEGSEIEVTDLSLTGKMAQLLPAHVDAVAYLHRDKKNNLMLDFRGGDSLTAGARPEHLKGQNIQISTTDDDGNITYHWDKIFRKQ